VGIFLKQLQEGKPLTIVSPGTIRRDFTYVSDVVEANILAMTSKKVGHGEVINIGFGKNYSINEVVSLILSKAKGNTIYVPELSGESRITLADNKKAKILLSWKPKISFEEGIKSLL
jgi:UDP-glucose 4-epimerase